MAQMLHFHLMLINTRMICKSLSTKIIINRTAVMDNTQDQVMKNIYADGDHEEEIELGFNEKETE